MREMTRAQKIRAFNESNAPFYLVDHTDEVSLCCVFHPMPDSVFSLGQEAFNRYAERIGDPVKDEYGLLCSERHLRMIPTSERCPSTARQAASSATARAWI